MTVSDWLKNIFSIFFSEITEISVHCGVHSLQEGIYYLYKMNQIYNFSLEQVVNERIASFMENLILLACESQFAAAVCQEYSLFIVPIKIFVHGPFPVPSFYLQDILFVNVFLLWILYNYCLDSVNVWIYWLLKKNYIEYHFFFFKTWPHRWCNG